MESSINRGWCYRGAVLLIVGVISLVILSAAKNPYSTENVCQT